MNTPCESCGQIGAWLPKGQFDSLCPACGGLPIPAPEPAIGEAGSTFAGHSPGPWIISNFNGTHINSATQTHICQVWGADEQINARLIAAAPSLLSERDALLAKLEQAKAALRELLQAEHDARKTPGHGPGSLRRAAKRAAQVLAELDA